MKFNNTLYRFLLAPTLLMAFLGPGSLWSMHGAIISNGGTVFIATFVLLVIFFGVPMFISEFLMGTWMKGPIKMFRTIPILQGLAFGAIAIVIIGLPYYTVIASYSVVYLRTALTNFDEAFTSCTNDYNTPYCDSGSHGGEFSPGNFTSGSDRNDENQRSPAIEHYLAAIGQTNFYGSDQVALNGGFNSNVAFGLTMFCIALIPFFIMVPASLGIFSTISFIVCSILLIILLIRGVTLAGAKEGLAYAFTADTSHFARSTLSNDAVNSIIYRLSLGMGIIPTLTHYGKSRYKFWGIDIAVVVFLFIVFILAQICLIFSYMGFLAFTNGVAIGEVFMGGFKTVYISMPSAFSHLPGGSRFAQLFFAYVFLLGLTSVATVVETVSNCCLVLFQTLFPKFASRHENKLRIFFGLGVIAYALLFGLGYCDYEKGLYRINIVDANCIMLLPFFMAIQLLVGAVFLLLGALLYATPLQLSMAFRVFTVSWALVMVLLALSCFVQGIRNIIDAFAYDPTALGIIVAILPLLVVIGASLIVLVTLLVRKRKPGEGKVDGVLLPSLATKIELYEWSTERDLAKDPEMTALQNRANNGLYPVEMIR